MAVIRPRTTVNNKNEFNVSIEPTKAGSQDMSLFPKDVVKEADETVLKELQEKIQQRRNDIE